MSETEIFLSTFDPVPEETRLPAAILADYTPDSCLADKGGRFVWRMRRRSDGALFVLKAAPLADRDLMEEFCILARLSPLLPEQVPAPVSYFQDEETEYLIRAYLPGVTLAQYREQEDGCSPERCIQLGQKLCALLETIHSQQPPVIHRDIKPENVLLLPSGELALIDFSIARQYKAGQDTDTRHMGTRATAAPEQYGYAQTDGRTDLYALGMTLIWLLTGGYRAEALESVHGPKYLRGVLETAVSFAPESRYQDAASFSSALAGHPPRQKPPASRRKPRAALLLPVLLAVLAVGAGLLWRQSRTVTFSSQNLEAAVRLELDRPEGPVTYDDLAQIRHLGVVGDRVFSAGELFEYAESCYRIDGEFYLVDGHSGYGDVADLSLLAHMPNLEELYLCRQTVRDVSALEGLPLVTLALNENQISDLSPIASLTELETLYLNKNPATNYGALAGLENLRHLSLGGGEADSLAFLEPLGLRELVLDRLRVLDGNWRPLASQNNLDLLELHDSPAEAMEAVRSLSGLRELGLYDCALRDLTPLSGLDGLNKLVVRGLESLEGVRALSGLRELRMSDSVLSDLSPLGGLHQLRSLQTANLPNVDFTTLPKDLVLDEIRMDEARMAEVEAAWPDHTFHILPP